jgi:hypothetical protein
MVYVLFLEASQNKLIVIFDINYKSNNLKYLLWKKLLN